MDSDNDMDTANDIYLVGGSNTKHVDVEKS